MIYLKSLPAPIWDQHIFNLIESTRFLLHLKKNHMKGVTSLKSTNWPCSQDEVQKKELEYHKEEAAASFMEFQKQHTTEPRRHYRKI